MKPREIAAMQLDAMMAAAKEVWERESPQLDERYRDDIKRLCFEHLVAHFARVASRRKIPIAAVEGTEPAAVQRVSETLHAPVPGKTEGQA